MRRADRLFQIVQLIRRDHITTAAKLSVELGISERTLYRNIADLMASGVPIESEAGVGYRLPRNFDLPPLMFTVDEAEAIHLGLRMAGAWADDELREAAQKAAAKLDAVLPERLKTVLAGSRLNAPGFHVNEALRRPLAELRRAVRERQRVWMRYNDQEGKLSERAVRPLGLYFWGGTWTLAAWCEARNDFRTFRLDRMEAWHLIGGSFPKDEGRELEDYLRIMKTAERE